MLEGKINPVAPRLLTADGTTRGLITVTDTEGFRIKQTAFLVNNTLPPLPVQIKRVLSHTQLLVGLVDNKIASWPHLDVSAFTVASGASIGAELQNKNNIPWEDHYRAIYESDPVDADRVILVDKYGDHYDANNPLPTSGGGGTGGIVEVITPSQAIFTLGSLGIPEYLKEILGSLEYDGVDSSTVGNNEVLTFTLGGVSVFSVVIQKTATGWRILTSGFFGYLLQETGDRINLEDGSGALLLEI